jgi:pyruvate formate lyase activating enzyme
MKIYGLQKMTLLDYPEHVAATVFLNGCDFRCPYCHNFELVDGRALPIMEEAEFFSFLEKRKGILDGIAISGGEPCLHKDLPEFIKRIREYGYKIKLDTNGYHPDMLSGLIQEGLVDYIAMDIKNSFDKYGITVGAPNLDTEPVRRSIDILMNSSIEYEFRTTVIKEYHEEKDFEKIGEMIKGAKKYFIQQYTCRETVPDQTLNPPSEEELKQYLVVLSKNVPNARLRGV